MVTLFVSVSVFCFRTISQKPNLAYICSTMSPGNPYFVVKGHGHSHNNVASVGPCTLVSQPQTASQSVQPFLHITFL